MNTMNASSKQTMYLSSLGHMAALFQVGVAEVQAALDRIGAAPVAVVNGVALYSGDDHNKALLAIAPPVREVKSDE